MNIKELQAWVEEDWANSSNARPSSEQQILFILEELGEVAEAIRKNAGNKERTTNSVDIGSEIADLVVSIVTVANTHGVDISNELEKFQARLADRHQQGF